MTREAALEVLRRLPAPYAKTNQIGFRVWAPHDADAAVLALARHGNLLDRDSCELLQRALDHYERSPAAPTHPLSIERTLRQGSIDQLPTLLGDRAVPYLSTALTDRVRAEWAVFALLDTGRAPMRTVLDAVSAPELGWRGELVRDRFLRTRFAHDADLAASLRALDDPRASTALAVGALAHDPERLRGVWLERRDGLPPWRVETAFAPLGLVPRDAGIAFLIDQDTRRWVRGLEMQVWPHFGLRAVPELALYSLARHDAERRVVLFAPSDDESLVETLFLVSSRDRLRDAVDRAHRNDEWGSREGLLCLPRIERVLAPHGVVAIDWRDAAHSEAMRVGGLARHTFDRPFLIVDWDARREEALGVGLVTGPMLLEDTLASLTRD